MVENVSQLPVKKGKIERSSTLEPPFESLRQEINRMFDDFGWGSWPTFRRSLFATEPMFSRGLTRTNMLAVDVAESEKAYEVTAELPGIDEKNIEVKVANGILTMKGEKQEEKEEKNKDYYLQERHYGSFERSFEIPEGLIPTRSRRAYCDDSQKGRGTKACEEGGGQSRLNGLIEYPAVKKLNPRAMSGGFFCAKAELLGGTKRIIQLYESWPLLE
ncbi:MAG: Hsp20/alpha crystallin family protein [Pseudolabrys sp.]